MATYTYPGVYVEELPSSVRSIAAVGTSITAFIGRALRGPVNVPTTLNNYGDFERVFGGLWAESPLSYAVWDFFKNGGTQAIVVRLFTPTFVDEPARLAEVATLTGLGQAAATAVLQAAQAAVAVANATPASVVEAARVAAVAAGEVPAAVRAALVAAGTPVAANAATPASVVAAARAAAQAVPADPDTRTAAFAAVTAGETAAAAANATAVTTTAAITQAATDAAAGWAGADAAATAAETADADPNVADVPGLQAAVDAVVNAQAPGPAQAAAQAVRAAAVGATKPDAATAARAAAVAFQRRRDGTAPVGAAATAENARVAPAAVEAAMTAARGPAIADAVAVRTPAPAARIAIGALEVHAASPGSWGNTLRARLTHDDAALFPATDPPRFTLMVRDDITGKVEIHRRLSVVAGDTRSVTEVLANESALVRVPVLPAARPAAHGPAPRGEELTTVGAFSSPSTANGVRTNDGLVPDRAAYEGNQDAKTGLYALERADLFNLLVIPPPRFDADLDASIWPTAAEYCRRRRAFLIVDPLQAWATKDAARNGLAGLVGNIAARSHAAIFFPFLRRPDPLRGDQLRNFVPSGAVAGVFARTDASRGVWKAPAGLESTLAGVPELSVPLTDAENGELNPLGLNCLRALPAAGRVVWGARTVDGDDRLASQWKYVPVRRLALFIEESLFRGTHWVVFEGNDEKLWSQIRLNVGAFMHNLFRQGAFQGTSPRESYFVKCDTETNPQADIDQGIVNIVVGFKPLKPAEFVVLKIQQIAGDVQA